MEFEHEEISEDEMEKKSITFGFSAILDSIVNNERSHNGYAKLEPNESQRRDRIILDPHSPLTWTTKHYVQRRTPYDALEGLAKPTEDKLALLPPQEMKAIEDKTTGRGGGKSSKVSKLNKFR